MSMMSVSMMSVISVSVCVWLYVNDNAAESTNSINRSIAFRLSFVTCVRVCTIVCICHTIIHSLTLHTMIVDRTSSGREQLTQCLPSLSLSLSLLLCLCLLITLSNKAVLADVFQRYGGYLHHLHLGLIQLAEPGRGAVRRHLGRPRGGSGGGGRRCLLLELMGRLLRLRRRQWRWRTLGGRRRADVVLVGRVCPRLLLAGRKDAVERDTGEMYETGDEEHRLPLLYRLHATPAAAANSLTVIIC